MFTCSLGNGRFGVTTFYASVNQSSNGSLNTTASQSNEADAEPSPVVVSPIYHGVQPSVRILGNFQRLFQLSHKSLCRYVDAMVGRHEQVVFVQEFYETSLKDAIRMEMFKENLQACLRIGCQLEMALAYLHSQGIVVGNLCVENVMLCSPGTWPPLVKLFNYALFWTSENGCLVEFPITLPAYLAPEVVLSALTDPEKVGKSSSASPGKNEHEFTELNFFNQLSQSTKRLTVFSDVWTLGIVLAETFTSTELSSTASNLHQLLSTLVNIAYRTSGEATSACDMVFRSLKYKGVNADEAEQYKEDCIIFEKLLRGSLELVPSARLLPKQALENLLPRDMISELKSQSAKGSRLLGKGLNPFMSRCQTLTDDELVENNMDESSLFELIPASISVIDHLCQTRPLEEVYYLLSLVSPDPRVLVKKAQIQAKSLPAICKMAPLFLYKAERSFGAIADRGSYYVRAVVEIPLEPLINRVNANFQVEDLYCLLEKYPEIEETEQQISAKRSAFFEEIQKQPLVIRERDPEYQLHRCVLFHRLLEGYPYTKAKLMEAVRVDIVPLYRGLVWCCLLDVPADAYEYYSNVDVDSVHPSHRQIDVDIPRCHQYDDLLASHMGRIKLKRVLTAWLRKNPGNVYWQGLDSLLAPFLRLNFTNEALALSCFQRFIDKYLNNFFTRDNSDVVREYLGVFSHLITFHDAELSAHLQKIGFVPDLYAISWFLTAFAHVFPLTKLYHLYDTLLLYDNNFLLCIGLAVLQQLRSKLITYEFNDCILLSSDMSDHDTSRLVADAVSFYQTTPPSLMRHPLSDPKKSSTSDSATIRGNASDLNIGQSARRVAAAALLSANDHVIHSDPVVVSDPCGRISVHDLQNFWNVALRELAPLAAHKLVTVDIRSQEEYSRGAFPGSINIPTYGPGSSPAEVDQQLQRLIAEASDNWQVVPASPNPTGRAESITIPMQLNVTTTYVIICNPKAGYAMAVELARRFVVDLLMSRVCILSGGTEALARSSLLVIP